MGNTFGRPDSTEARKMSRKIDHQIKKDVETVSTVLKIILLGSGESGKSTVAKQMQVLKLSGFSIIEKDFYKKNIRLNVVQDVERLGHVLSKQIPTTYGQYMDTFENAKMCAAVKSESATKISKEIDQQIKQEVKNETTSLKIILLGSGESGKSTLAKQMKVLKLAGFSEQEKTCFKQRIRSNLVTELVNLGGILSKERPTVYKQYMDTFENSKIWCDAYNKHWGEMSRDLSMGIMEVSNDSTITDMIKKKHKSIITALSDSALYWFENMNRIAAEDFNPTADDILRCRVPTMGAHELSFVMNQIDIKVIDVGGQKGQRRKWIHFFEDVQGMIFVTAISDYNKMMDEDNKTNRLHDGITLFEALVKDKHFQNASVLLFFNKKDVFMEKIPLVPLSVCFAEYSGENNYDTASQYIAKKFLGVKPTEKEVYVHFTNATDTKNIDRVFELSFNIILKANFRAAGIA